MTFEEYFGDWLKVIDKDILYKTLSNVNREYKTKQCEPAYNDIFKVFHITPYNKLRVIILGMDPYPQKNIATGIAFGNKSDAKILSPSLNILKESVIDFEKPHNSITFDPTLEEWCRQGVLLLNSALTVERFKPGSHSVLWRDFIKSLLHNISEWNSGLIYVLMGSQAKTFINYIGKNNLIIKTNHPSYYARTNTRMPNVFKDIDSLLLKYWNEKIEWYKEIKFYDTEI